MSTPSVAPANVAIIDEIAQIFQRLRPSARPLPFTGAAIAQSHRVGACGTLACHFRRIRFAAVCLLVGMAALTLVASCNQDIPVIAVGPKSPDAHATIYGIVRGPSDTSAEQRIVDVVNVATGERREVQTSSTGAFTVEVPAGRYRLTLPLRAGETLVKAPDDIDLDHGEIKSHIEFVIVETRVAHPRGPADRVDNGLRSPIA